MPVTDGLFLIVFAAGVVGLAGLVLVLWSCLLAGAGNGSDAEVEDD